MKKSVLLFLELMLMTVLAVLFPVEGWAYQFDTWSDEGAVEVDLFEGIEGEVMAEVSLEGKFLNGDLLKVSVVVGEVKSSVLGVAFNLAYDAVGLSFLRYNPGNFLEEGGDPFYLVQNDIEAGRLIFGETLRRDDEFPEGGGRLVDFYFQILEGEKFEFGFEKGVISTLNVVRQDLERVDWGRLEVEKMPKNEGVLSFEEPKSLVMGSQKSLWLWASIMALFSSFMTVLLLKKRSKQSVNFK